MNVLHSKTRIALAVLAMVASAGAAAAPIPISNYSTSGTVALWNTPDPSITTGELKKGVGTLAQALDGNAGQPGGNVELGKYGQQQGSISGMVGAKQITLSSLDRGDWTLNENALAYRYVGGAAGSIGQSLDKDQLDAAVNSFLNVNVFVGGVDTGFQPWSFVSDPNVSYAYIDDKVLNIGLAGFMDASLALSGLFSDPALKFPAKSQVSEVVEVTVDGVSQYLFGFSATNSGVYAATTGVRCDLTPQFCSYSGNYNVKIPEPESLALLGIGLVGLFLGRRRRV